MCDHVFVLQCCLLELGNDVPRLVRRIRSQNDADIPYTTHPLTEPKCTAFLLCRDCLCIQRALLGGTGMMNTALNCCLPTELCNEAFLHEITDRTTTMNHVEFLLAKPVICCYSA